MGISIYTYVKKTNGSEIYQFSRTKTYTLNVIENKQKGNYFRNIPLPRGYARWTRSGLVFHDPQRCQRWSSDGTESFDLTDGSLDLEPNCSVD